MLLFNAMTFQMAAITISLTAKLSTAYFNQYIYKKFRLWSWIRSYLEVASEVGFRMWGYSLRWQTRGNVSNTERTIRMENYEIILLLLLWAWISALRCILILSVAVTVLTIITQSDSTKPTPRTHSISFDYTYVGSRNIHL